MNRKQFISELAFLLQDVEDVERVEALQYYEDYFDEAGPENEQELIASLGSPERVAAIIKAGLDDRYDQDIEFSESGMDNAYFKESHEIIEATIVDDKTGYHQSEKKESHFKGDAHRNKILLIGIIIAAIILLLPIGGGAFGIGLGFLGGIIGVSLAIMFGGVGCFIGAIVSFIKAVMIIGDFTGAGLLLLALGFALIALSNIFFALAKVLIKIIPLMITGIVNICRTIFDRVGERR